MNAQRPRVWIELSRHLDPHAWPAQHAAGQVPNRTPYGLGDLADHGFEVSFRPQLKGRVPRRIARAVYNRYDDLEWPDALAALRVPEYRSADVVLCWTEFAGIPAGFRAALTGGAPIVMGAAHLTDPAGRTPRFLWAAAHALPRMRVIFVHSEAMIPVLRDFWGLDGVRLDVVPFGIDPEFFVPSHDAIDRDLVVSVGDDARRDHDTLVRAMAQVREHRPSVRLELATLRPVTLPPELGTLIREHLGPRRPRFYGRAALVAIATKPNVHGSGLTVMLEAMGCARPYVVSEAAGLSEYVRHGEDGLVVPPGDVDALAGAIRELLDDPERADAFGRAGRQRLERELTTNVQARELAKVLREALDG